MSWAPLEAALVKWKRLYIQGEGTDFTCMYIVNCFPSALAAVGRALRFKSGCGVVFPIGWLKGWQSVCMVRTRTRLDQKQFFVKHKECAVVVLSISWLVLTVQSMPLVWARQCSVFTVFNMVLVAPTHQVCRCWIKSADHFLRRILVLLMNHLSLSPYKLDARTYKMSARPTWPTWTSTSWKPDAGP